jgi:hypothetical protein
MKLGHAALTYILNMSKDMQHGYVTYVVLYRWDGIVFPSQNNNIILYLFGVLQTMWQLEIFNSAPVGFDDPSRVSC